MDLRPNYSHEFRPPFARGEHIGHLDTQLNEKRTDLDNAKALESGHKSAVSRITSEIHGIGGKLTTEKDVGKISLLVSELQDKNGQLFVSMTEEKHEQARRERLESEVKSLEEQRKRMADMKGGRGRRRSRGRRTGRRRTTRKRK